MRGWLALLGAFVALSTSALSGCGGDDDGGLWTLRPNVSVVLSSEAAIISETIITDVDRDGDRIILLRPSTSSASTFIYAYLSLSEDAGKTWRHVQVPKEIYSELGGDTYQIGIHLEHGKIYLMLSRDIGSHLPAWAVFEIDPITGDPTEQVIPLTRTGWFAEKRLDGHLRYGLSSGLIGVTPHSLFEFDPATGEGSYENFPCTGMACSTPIFHSPDGGETWDGYTQVQPNLPVCVTHWDVASVKATEACVNRPVWPGVNYNFIPTNMYRGTTPYMAWSMGEQGSEQAYATALLPGNPPTVSETLMLGQGVISTAFRTGTMVRPRFATFELVEKFGGAGHLVRLAENGPELVQFPVTPCTVDAGCGYEDFPSFGYGQVQWILPPREADGDYLVFYTTQVDPGGRETIYLAHERPTFGPITDGVPLPPPDPVELPPGAQPMNDLEKACAVAANCDPVGSKFVYPFCLEHWITDTASRPGLAAARARFIAAATSCASLDALAASGCPLECTESGGSCGASGTGPCSTEVSFVPGNCGTCDGGGNYLLCSSSRMFTVACGSGTACSSGYGCALTGTNACDAYQPAPSCVNGAVRECDNNTGKLLTLAHCDLEGATCDTATATCVPTSSQGSCNPATFGTQCASATSPTHLLTCAYGQIKYLACSDIGYTECVVGSQGANCH